MSAEAIQFLRDLAERHGEKSARKRTEAAVLSREADIHNSLWATIDNEADRLESAMKTEKP